MKKSGQKWGLALLVCFSAYPRDSSRWQGQPAIQESTVPERYQPLSLIETIERGLRLNYRQQERSHIRKMLKLDLQTARDDFIYPKVSLRFITDQQLARLGAKTTPLRGYLRLGLEPYSLFNWGKNHLRFLNFETRYKKTRRNLSEGERALRHQLIIGYFRMGYRQKVFEARRHQLRQTSFVYRLNKERIAKRKIGKQEYYQSRGGYLTAQDDYHAAQKERRLSHRRVARMMADKGEHLYVLRSELNYTRLNLTFEEALALAKEKNPRILDARADLNNSRREYEMALKESWPLPKVDLNLGAYTHAFGEETSGYSGVDVRASIDLTWTLGKHRGLAKGRLAKGLAEVRLNRSKHHMEHAIRDHFTTILALEDRIKILAAQEVNLRRFFELALDNYLNRKTSFLYFQEALLKLVEAEILLARYRYWHTREKVLLAGSIGVDDYPGQRFESLAKEAGP